MNIAVITGRISSIAYSANSLGFSNCFLNRPDNVLSLMDALLNNQSQPPLLFHVSAVSPPPTKTLTKRRVRRNRRVKSKIIVDDGDGGKNGLFAFREGWDYNDGDGFLGSGGGGKGWSFGGHGGANGEDNSMSDPAFDFVYEILRWIAMLNCLHFAFRKVVRFRKGSNEIVPRLLNGKG